MLDRQIAGRSDGVSAGPPPAGRRPPMAAPSIKAVDVEAAAPPPRRKRAPFVLGGLLVIAAGVGDLSLRLSPRQGDDGRRPGRGARRSISARIPGQVKRVLVQDNQAVKAGEVLVELDDRDHQAQLAAARADLAAGAGAAARGARPSSRSPRSTRREPRDRASGGIAQAAAVTGSTQALIDQATRRHRRRPSRASARRSASSSAPRSWPPTAP